MYLKLPSFILHTTFNLSQGIDTLLVIHRFTVILIKIIRRILRRIDKKGNIFNRSLADILHGFLLWNDSTSPYKNRHHINRSKKRFMLAPQNPLAGPEIHPVSTRKIDRAWEGVFDSHRTNHHITAKHKLIGNIVCDNILCVIIEQRSHDWPSGLIHIPRTCVKIRL